MITTIWDSAGGSPLQNSPYQYQDGNAATQPSQLQISSAAAQTGVGLVQVDLGTVQNVGDDVAIEVEVTNPAAGGQLANQSVTLQAACASSGSKQPPELLTAATPLVCPLSTVPGRTQVYTTPAFKMVARYLYMWFDHTILANAPLNLRLRVNGKTG
jgi:hypothetical protein